VSHPLRVLAAVLLVIAGLTVLDQFLARTEMVEVQGAAERSWRKGMRLLNEGRAGEALDALRNAHALERDNPTYELDMISALIALGQTSDADPLMDELLTRRPNDGYANLIAARLKAKEGDPEDAKAFYHRAIYGEWPDKGPMHASDARLELIRYLEREHSRQELLAELISFEAQTEGNEALQHKVAELFLVADSPARAAAVYRELIAQNPDDASAYEGLGEAEMQEGEYRAARTAFVQASAHHEGGISGARLVLLNEVIQLDPTPRRLPTAEKFERSLRILALAKGDLEAQLEKRPGAANEETAVLLKSAADVAAAKPPHMLTNELAEQNLDLAMKIWKVRLSLFGPSTAPDEEALKLTMEHLAS
jgi:tetratricopeptide (TPR) repeat protein